MQLSTFDKILSKLCKLIGLLENIGKHILQQEVLLCIFELSGETQLLEPLVVFIWLVNFRISITESKYQ